MQLNHHISSQLAQQRRLDLLRAAKQGRTDVEPVRQQPPDRSKPTARRFAARNAAYLAGAFRRGPSA